MTEVDQMITELYNKLVLKRGKPEAKPRKVSLRQYFVWCYVKESIYRDMTPFKLERGTIDEVANSAAQITFKLLTDTQKSDIKKAYEAMSEEELEHLKNL